MNEDDKTIHLLRKNNQCMALPLKTEELINGHIVEWERLEFKESWNPEPIMHSICAFANDMNNWGGGYIIIGIEDKDGKLVLPPKGVHQNQVDNIQKAIHEVCHKISPIYVPLVEPVMYGGKHVVIIWAPGGENRPYKAPVSMAKKEKQKAYYIRRYSKTVMAKHAEEVALINLAAKVPFDDRINHAAEITDLNLQLIQSFLQEVGSDLYAQSSKMSFEDLCRQMQIAKGSKEFFKPINAGVLFFSEHPEKFFPGAIIEVVIFHDEIGDQMTEKKFDGPIHIQLRNALEYIKSQIIVENVLKVPRQAEAIRFFNYPYEAVEETLANAIYHRSYEERAPIVVSIRDHKMIVHSKPGPLPPLNNQAMAKEIVSAGAYRNRRIGDFLKELNLTEGRETGFPKIRRSMKSNGSPAPTFKTDKGRTYFTATLPERQLSPTESNAIAKVNFKLSENHTLNKRQLKAVEYVRKNGRITNVEYRNLFSISRALAKRDLSDLSAKQILIQIGEGRASAYELLVVGADKYPAKKAQTIPTSLDKKISRLEKELDAIHPDKTIQELDSDIFFKIFDSWLSELMRKVIPVAQRFNKFFLEAGHFASVVSGMGFIKFTNDDVEDVIQKLRSECLKNRKNIVGRKTEFQLNFNYVKLIKGGTKAFSMQYNMGVEFGDITYNVFMDEYPDSNVRSHVKQFEDRLFRKSVTEKELDELTNKMGEILLEQMELHKKRNGIK